MELTKESQKLIDLFDKDLNLMYRNILRTPDSIEDKMAVDAFIDIANNIDKKEDYSWKAPSNAKYPTSFEIKLFKKEDSNLCPENEIETFVRLGFNTHDDQDDKKIYYAGIGLRFKGVIFNPNRLEIIKPEDYDSIKNKITQIAKYILE